MMLTVLFLRRTAPEYQGPRSCADSNGRVFLPRGMATGTSFSGCAPVGPRLERDFHEMRDPMFVLVLVAELLKFQLNGPALSLLLQLPPQTGKFDAFTLPLSHQKGGSALSPFKFQLVSDDSIRYMLPTPIPHVSHSMHLGKAGQALPDLYERRDPMFV